MPKNRERKKQSKNNVYKSKSKLYLRNKTNLKMTFAKQKIKLQQGMEKKKNKVF